MTTVLYAYACLSAMACAVPVIASMRHHPAAAGVIWQTAAAITSRHLRMPLARMPANDNRRRIA